MAQQNFQRKSLQEDQMSKCSAGDPTPPAAMAGARAQNGPDIYIHTYIHTTFI